MLRGVTGHRVTDHGFGLDVEGGARVTVAVDSDAVLQAAVTGGVREVLIDVNVGLPRCGCDPQDAGRLADAARAAGLEVRGVMGYEGPLLSNYLDLETQSWVPRMRWAKSEAEVDLIRESAKWANLGHRYLADLTEPGVHPATVSQRASMEGSRAMLDTLGDRFVERVRGSGPVHAGYISAHETALPHGHTPNQRLCEGDVLVTGASANVDGYFSELERTMFVGEPSDEQEHYFELMLESQTIAIEALGPGVSLSSVDEAVWSYFEEQGITDLAQHHVGHNIGMDGHEPPYIDRGWSDHCASEETSYGEAEQVMEPGHVYTIEPGIYTDEAGYRHSDTIAITEDGIEWLTYYPRELESNVIRGAGRKRASRARHSRRGRGSTP